MKILAISDLHLDFALDDYNKGDLININQKTILFNYCNMLFDKNVDVINIAGDISNCNEITFIVLDWLKENTSSQVIFVPGNHDFYNRNYQQTIELYSKKYNDKIKFLYNNKIKIADWTFLGTTLWTDLSFKYKHNIELGKNIANKRMNDYKYIKYEDNYFTPNNCIFENKKAINYIISDVTNNKDDKYIIITHHAPSAKSISKEYTYDITNHCYVNNYGILINKLDNIKYFIHGHIHSSSNYKIGNCHVICNPFGYIGYEEDKYKKLILNI